jgi:membrane fusion protein (multidrug efflux system)
MKGTVGTLLLLAATCVIQSGCAGDDSNVASAQPPPPVVIVGTVSRQSVALSQDYQGTIGAVTSIEIRARVEGTLDEAPFKEGTLVRKGQLLFRIQDNQYVAALRNAQAQLATAHAQVAQAQGNLTAAQATLKRATITVDRDRPLAAAKAIPQKDLDNAIQSQAAAEGNVAVAQAQIQEAKAAVLSGAAAVDNATINLGYTTIYAPATGLMGYLNYDVGNVVGGTSTQVLDTLTAIDPIKVNFAVDESTYLALSSEKHDPQVRSLRDQDIHLVLANNATYPFAGRLYTVNPTLDAKTGTINVEARFPNPDGLLRPGGFARIRLIVEKRPNVLLVPQTAIVQTQGMSTAYVVDRNNVVSLHTVTLGPQYEQSYIVQSGLSAGDKVVVQGTQKVRAGGKVVTKPG